MCVTSSKGILKQLCTLFQSPLASRNHYRRISCVDGVDGPADTPSEGGKTHLPSWQSTLFSEPKVFPDSHRPHVTRGEPQPRRRAASRIR